MGFYNYLFGWLGLNIHRGDLVLEVGSGGHPFARSNVLCDMFVEDGVERAEGDLRQSIIVDRPFICGNAERLPFRDKAFDFILSAHMLEHLIHPEAFLEEAMRVSNRGYLVTPSDFCERILPRATHLWLISVEEGVLVLRQKTQANENVIPGLLHEAWAKDYRFRLFFAGRPDLFETRFTWTGRFQYKIIRYQEQPDWLVKGRTPDVGDLLEIVTPGRSASLWQRLSAARRARIALSFAIRRLHAGKADRDVYSILACPVCRGDLQRRDAATLFCANCQSTYPIRSDGIPVLLPEAARKDG